MKYLFRIGNKKLKLLLPDCILRSKHRNAIMAGMKYYLSVITAIFLWSASFIGTKIAYQSFSPLVLCLVRFIGASLFMTLIRFVRRDHTRLPEICWKPVIASAVFGITIYYALENISLTYTSASNASLIQASYPAITALVGILFYHARLGKDGLLGIVISVIGVVILTGAGFQSGGFFGNFLLVADGFLWGFYNYIVERIPRDNDTFTVTYWQTLIGTIFFIPLIFLEERKAVNITFEAIAAVGFLSVFCVVLALLLYNYGLKGVSANTASALMNLMPLFGVILSALILHENIQASQMIGGALAILGVLIGSGVFRKKK